MTKLTRRILFNVAMRKSNNANLDLGDVKRLVDTLSLEEKQQARLAAVLETVVTSVKEILSCIQEGETQ